MALDADRVERWVLRRDYTTGPVLMYSYLYPNWEEVVIEKEKGVWYMSVLRWPQFPDPRREIAGNSTSVSEAKAIALAIYRLS